MANIKHLALFAITSISLLSCAKQGGESQVMSSSASSFDTSASSLKEAFAKLGECRNYTVETTIDNGDEKTTYLDIYTDHYVYTDYASDEEGFAEKDNAVFRLNLYHGDFLASDAYEGITSLWGSDLFTTLAFSESSIASLNGKSGTITNKLAKLQTLKFLKIEIENISYVESLSAEMSGDSLEGLTVKLVIDGWNYTSVIKEVGTTDYKELTDFLVTAKSASIPEPLALAKSHFMGNNYRRLVQSEVTVSEETKQRWGYEYFLPDYFYTAYNAASGASIQSCGYLSLHPDMIVDGHPEYGTFNGAYRFSLSEDLSSVASFLSTGPAFVTDIYDMPSIMDYPSLMKMWDHNLQYFEHDPDAEYDGVTYATDDEYLVADFFRNSQVGYLLPSYQTLYLKKLSVTFDDASTDDIKDDKVTFLLEFKLDGEVYQCEYFYSDFGNSQIPAVEEFKSLFVPA